MRGSGEIPNGLGMAQLWPTLNAPSIRPVVHSTLRRWRESLAAWAAWAMEMYLSIVFLGLISATLECIGDGFYIVEKFFGRMLVEFGDTTV